jgi:hypothetical protein
MNARRRKRDLWVDFGNLILDEADFNRHIDYIHWNPVKHGTWHSWAIGRIRASIGMSNS